MSLPSATARLIRFWPLLLIAAVAATALALGLHRSLSLEGLFQHRLALKAWIGANPVLAMAAFIAIYVVAVAIALPGAAILTLAGGFLFGWLGGALGAVIGATLGAMVLFFAARTALGDVMRQRAGGAIEKIASGFHEDAASYLLFLRLVPIFPFFIVNLAAAALRAPPLTFAWTTVVGIIPATAAFALTGAGLDSVLAHETAAFDRCVAAGGSSCKLAFSLSSLLTPVMVTALVHWGWSRSFRLL